MLTIKALGSASGAMHYYLDKDNYYLTDKQEMEQSTQWMGKGADKLKAKGAVEPEQFLALLDGRLPSGQLLGITKKKGERQHRTGTDVTVSAPKSVSLLALVGKDTRVIDAHKKAVTATINRIEEMAAEARITLKGHVMYEKTKNLTVASFLHTTSRALDPNLHSHLVILNMTERADGLWRALSSRDKKDKDNLNNGFREILYDNQHYFGLIYTSTLAKEIRSLGFDIEITDKYGNFEIIGLSKDYIKDSSKRRNEILDTLKGLGLSSAKAAEAANLDNRPNKEGIEPEVVEALWQGEAEKHEVNFDKLIAASKEKDSGEVISDVLPKVCDDTKEAVNDALLHLSQFNARIKHADLVRQSFVFAAGQIDHEAIEHEIKTRLEDKKLLGTLSESYTTAELLDKEKTFSSALKASKRTSFSIDTKQSGISHALLKNTDRVQIVDIKTLGVEKNLLQDIVDCNDAQGLNTYVLHQGKFQTNQIKEQVKRDTSSFIKWFKSLFKDEVVHTVAGFKYAYPRACEQTIFKNRKDVIVVHDAQKLKYDDIQTLDSLAQESNSKLVLLNNMQSTDGFHPGSPINVLKEVGVAQHKTHFANKKAPCSLYETPNPHEELIKHYQALIPSEREKTALLAATKKEQGELTGLIRAQLKAENALSIQEKQIKVLSTETLSPAQKKHTKFYKEGDVISVNPFTKEQDNYRVSKIANNQLTVIDGQGKQSLFDLTETKEAVVYKQNTLDVAIGERLIATNLIKHNQLRIEKGSEMQVQAISASDITLTLDKRTFKLSDTALSGCFVAHDYVKRPNQLNKAYDKALIGSKPFQVSQELLNDVSLNAKHIEVYSTDKKATTRHLDKERISWTIEEVAQDLSEPVKRDIRYASSVIEKDINYLAKHLSNKHRQLDSSTIAKQAVAYAVAKCAERDAAFTHKELLSHAMIESLGKASADEIHAVIDERKKKGDLVELDTHWITKETLELERAILADNKKHQGVLAPIVANKNDLLVMNPNLTQGQKDAVTLALTNKDRFISIQGLAGVGKTTMMKEVKKFANARSVEVYGLTPTHRARQELSFNGIPTQTVDSFLNRDEPFSSKTLFIADETSMIGNENYRSMQQKAISLNARIIYAGDITQLQSIPNGVPHELTVTTKTQNTAYMEDIIRQNPNPILKEAAYHASRGEVDKSFDKISSIKPGDFISRTKSSSKKYDQSVVEVELTAKDNKGEIDYAPIYDAITDDYLSRIPEHRETTLVIAHANEDRREIDRRIRAGLQKEGVVGKQETFVIRHEPKDLTLADKQKAQSYNNGDILRFDRTYSVARRGDYFKVMGINQESNTLTCLSNDQHTFTINPAKIAEKALLSAYVEKKYPVAIGDKIRLKKSDHQRKIAANTEYVLKSIEDKTLTLSNDIECVTIDLGNKADRHWDYAYSNTAFTIQGATDCFALSLELEKRKLSTTHRSHGIGTTRPSHQTTIYTENKEKLIQRMNDKKNQDSANKKSAFLMYKAYKERVAYEEVIKQQLSDELPMLIGKETPKSAVLSTKQSWKNSPTAKEIGAMLHSDMASLCGVLLGEPNYKMSSKNELRYGSKGSLSINLSKGVWNNFETYEKGNCFELIKTQMGFSDFKDVVEYAKDYLNCAPEDKVIRESAIKPHQLTDNQEAVKKREYARYLVSISTDIKGTIAEKYLMNTRKLTQFHNADLRFVKAINTYHGDKKTKVPALLAIARDKNGEVNNIEVVRLNPNTHDKDIQSNIVRQGYGAKDDCYVELNSKHKGGKTYVAEGVETGLSILEAKPVARVVAVLGKANFSNFRLSGLSKNIVFCLDNDGDATFKNDVIKSAIERVEKAKLNVSFIMPGKDNSDLNDILMSNSLIDLKATVNHELPSESVENLSRKAFEKDTIETRDAVEITTKKTSINDNNITHKTVVIEEKSQLNIDYNKVLPPSKSKKYPCLEREI